MSSRRLLLLFLAFLGLYAVGDWALPLVDRDEPRFAEASREMLERGDFIVPYFNNQTRFDKPPLIYWLQTASYKIFGDNEFAARLPSGVCGALATVVIAIWGGQLYDPKTGWRAALIFGLCSQAIIHSHAAVADMAMITASTAAAWAGWNWLKTPVGQPGRRKWWLAFWVLLAVGFLAKGPIAWIPIAMAAWATRRIDRGQRPTAGEWALGALVMLAVVGTWGIPALIQTRGQFAIVGLGKHVVLRSISPLEGHGAKTWSSYAITFPFFFVTIWPSFFPWSFWIPSAAGELWGRRKQWSIGETYLITGIVLLFGIFTLSRTKLPHYTLPAFPFIALLLAAWWGQKDRERLFRGTAIGMAVLSLAVALAVFPFARSLFVSQQLFNAAAPWLTRPMEMGTVGYQEPSVIWLFRKKIGGFDTSMNHKDAEDWMRRPGPRVCVMPVDQIANSFRKLDPKWHIVKAQGLKIANARRAALAAIIKM